MQQCNRVYLGEEISNKEVYGKAYYEEMLLKMVEPLKIHFSEGKSRLELGAAAAGYGCRIAGMEGFSRLLWGLAPYWAGGGTDKSMLPAVVEGLINGTDPYSEEYWGDLHDKDQRMVEMAAISNGLLLVPELLWEPLTVQEKENLSNWLYQINLYTQAENNWQFFNVLTNLALKKRGCKYGRERMQKAMDKYESFYLGNGWYSDGKRPQKDYYISFAIHYYCLLYAYYMEDEDPERAAAYRSRAKEFAVDFQYWFDEEGKGLPFGRSLTYRFAEVAFFSVCIMTGVEVLPYGVMRGIVGRHLRYWIKQPIFDNGGVLTVGYTYPNLMMSEGYNAPGSPYWSFKAFAFLALPEQHAFWQTSEEELPEREPIKLLAEADMLIASRKGEIVAYTAGQYSVIPYAHDAEKYEKFAYSSRFGFSVPRSYVNLNDCAPDSMLVFEVHDMLFVRRHCIEYCFTEEQVWAKWSPIEGITVETAIVPCEGGHIRKHRIENQLVTVVDGQYMPMSCKAYDCGFAYPFCQEETELVQVDSVNAVDGNALDDKCKITSKIVDRNGYSLIQCNSNNGKSHIINAAPNTNLIFPLTRIPALEFEIKPGITEIEDLVLTDFTTNPIHIGGGNCYEIWNE